jgi:hypothetical protein
MSMKKIILFAVFSTLSTVIILFAFGKTGITHHHSKFGYSKVYFGIYENPSVNVVCSPSRHKILK